MRIPLFLLCHSDFLIWGYAFSKTFCGTNCLLLSSPDGLGIMSLDPPGSIRVAWAMLASFKSE